MAKDQVLVPLLTENLMEILESSNWLWQLVKAIKLTKSYLWITNQNPNKWFNTFASAVRKSLYLCTAVPYTTICVWCNLTQKNCYLAKQCPSSRTVLKASLFHSSSHSQVPPAPGCSTPDQLSQLLSIPSLEHKWSLRLYSKTISNIKTCAGFKHCHWSQKWLLKILRTGMRLLKEQGSTFTLKSYFSFCILFNQNKNFQVSRCNKHYTEEK